MYYLAEWEEEAGPQHEQCESGRRDGWYCQNSSLLSFEDREDVTGEDSRGDGDFCGVLNGIWKEEEGDRLKLAEDKTCNLELICPSPLPPPFSLLSALDILP